MRNMIATNALVRPILDTTGLICWLSVSPYNPRSFVTLSNIIL